MPKRSTKKKPAPRKISAKPSAPACAARQPRLRLNSDWLWGAALLWALLLAYQPLSYAGFVWDDDQHVTANPVIVGPLGLKEIWTTSAAQYYPLVLTTFWIEHALWGLRPLPYHLVNILMHGACAILLWRLLLSLRVPGAWLGAALWALHPVQVETVAWIAELKNTQSCLFYLLSILCFVRATRALAPDSRYRFQFFDGLAWLSALLAMAGKSSTVVLPAVLCLAAWWIEGRWRWRNLIRVAPVVLLAIGSALLALVTVKLQQVDFSAMTWPERLITAGHVIPFYLGKLLWPHPLIFIYPRWNITASQWPWMLPLLAAAVLLGLFWTARNSWGRPWFFALAYFLIALFPVLGLVNHYFLRYSFVADHLQYLAGMGPLALAGAGLARFSAAPARHWLMPTLAAAVLALFGVLDWRQAWHYRTGDILWADTLAENPDCYLALNNLGTVLLQQGRVAEATAMFRKALQVGPHDAVAYTSLADGLLRQGRMDAAVAEYQKALAADPTNAITHNNFGGALFQLGRLDEAAAQFQAALQTGPALPQAHLGLGNVLLKKGLPDAALAEYRQAAALDPGLAEAHQDLALVLSQLGRVDEAIAEYGHALAIDPNLPEARDNLGTLLFQRGDVAAAAVQFQQALELDPNFADAHSNLGGALFTQNRLDAAIAEFQRALQLNPNLAGAHNNLGNALLQQGQIDAAIAQFREAIRLSPGHTHAEANLARALAQQKAAPP